VQNGGIEQRRPTRESRREDCGRGGPPVLDRGCEFPVTEHRRALPGGFPWGVKERILQLRRRWLETRYPWLQRDTGVVRVMFWRSETKSSPLSFKH
jgi:hypothetical protein